VPLQRLAQALREPLRLATKNPDQQGAERLTRARHELDQVGPAFHEPRNEWEHILRPSLGGDVEQLGVHLVADQAQRLADALRRDRTLLECERLVQEGEAVPHTTVGHPGYEEQRIVLGLHGFLVRHVPEPVDDSLGADASEIEPLDAAQDGGRCVGDLLRLRRGEDEYDPGGRLLQDLEERVPRLPREHVRLVHDVDLVSAGCAGGVHRPFAQLPRIVDAAIAGRVDLDDVQVGPAGPDANAGIALPTGLSAVSRPLLAVERHGQHAGCRGLADPARTGQQIGVCNAVPRDGAREASGDVILGDQVGKVLWTILAGERLMGHRRPDDWTVRRTRCLDV
jgi:hypothetical protein